jgi:hypothetical protein
VETTEQNKEKAYEPHIRKSFGNHQARRKITYEHHILRKSCGDHRAKRRK